MLGEIEMEGTASEIADALLAPMSESGAKARTTAAMLDTIRFRFPPLLCFIYFAIGRQACSRPGEMGEYFTKRISAPLQYCFQSVTGTVR
jgi:hypothetical protein